MTLRQETARPSRTVLAVRALLLVVLLVAGVHRLRAADDRPVGDLLQALARGSVQSVTVDASAQVATNGSGLPALWNDGALHPHLTRYDLVEGRGNPVLEAVRASPRVPDLTATQDLVDPRTGPGLHLAYRMLLVPLVALLLAGPEPHRATRWAWFWVGAVLPAAWLAFLVLEPTTLWQVREAPPRHPRVTAGWALLGAVVVSAALSQLLPGALRHALLIR